MCSLWIDTAHGDVEKVIRVSSHASRLPRRSKSSCTWKTASQAGSPMAGAPAPYDTACGYDGAHGTTARLSATLCAATVRRCCASDSARCHSSQLPGSCIRIWCVRHWRCASEANLLQSKQKSSPALFSHQSSAPAHAFDDDAALADGPARAAATAAALAAHALDASSHFSPSSSSIPGLSGRHSGASSVAAHAAAAAGARAPAPGCTGPGLGAGAEQAIAPTAAH